MHIQSVLRSLPCRVVVTTTSTQRSSWLLREHLQLVAGGGEAAAVARAFALGEERLEVGVDERGDLAADQLADGVAAEIGAGGIGVGDDTVPRHQDRGRRRFRQRGEPVVGLAVIIRPRLAPSQQFVQHDTPAGAAVRRWP